MKQFSAKDISRNAGDLWMSATVGPVAITKHRKPRFVVMSYDQYTALVGESTQVSLDVVNMPEDLGKLFDQGVEYHFSDK